MPLIGKSDILQQKAKAVYAHMLQEHAGNWGMNIEDWDWVPGVGVISMLEYYEQCGSQEVIQQLMSWANRNMQKAEHRKVINSVAPFAILPGLYLESGDYKFLEMAERTGQWILHEAPRTREGALEHTVTEDASFPEQVWADTVFMAVLFLAKLSRVTRNSDYAKEALRQLELHFDLLQDEQTGVLFHGWNCMTGDHMSAARWTRANAWIAVGTPMILKELEHNEPPGQELIHRYRFMMKGILGYQRESGLWNTVMDREDSYLETSGSAGIAAGLLKAWRLGLLDDTILEPVHLTVRTVLDRIDAHGVVQGVSGGTPVMPTIEAYNEIPCYPSLYGQGLALILLTEALI